MRSHLAKINRIIMILGLLTCELFAAVSTPWSATTAASSTAQSGLPATFAAPPLFSVAGSEVGVTGIYSMAKGDFNGDGVPDVAIAGFACANGRGFPDNSIAVYLGDGHGGFKPPAYYGGGPCPYQVIAGHVRGPNTPEDLVVVDGGVGNNVTVLLGNGDGTFQSPITVASFVGGITAAAIGDFNGDGKPDLAIAAWGGSGETGGNLNTVAILLGNGDGTFQPPSFYKSLNNPYGVVIGDFNKDGKLDLLMRNPEALAVSLGNGDGTFQPGYVVLAEPTTLASVNPPGPILNGLVSCVVADFNGDGNLDIAAAEDGERIDVLLGTGTGVFSPPVTYLNNEHQSGSGGGQIATARLAPNGHLDLVVNTGYGTTLAVFRGNGDGTFQSPTIYPLPQYDDEGLILADVNSDGAPDIITGTMGGRGGGDPNYLTVLVNDGNGGFSPPPPLFPVIAPYNQGTSTNAVGITAADLTKSGKLDLVVTDWDVPIEPLANGQLPPLPTVNFSTQQADTHGSISVLAGNGDGTFQTEQQYFVGGRPIAVQTGDLTGDGKIDIVVVNAFDNMLSILKGNGDRTYQPAISVPVGTNPTSLALADFNGDGKLDIAVTNLVDNTVAILINQSTAGTISFKTPVNYSVGTHPAGIVTRDFNHDGKLDLAVLNSGYFFSADDAGKHTTLSILLGNGDGSFAAAATQQIAFADGGDAIAAADFGRGETDLAVAHFGNGQVIILHGDGKGGFAPAGIYTVNAGAEGLVAADFNGDGKMDLAVSGLNDCSVALLLGKGDGSFVPVANQADDVARPFGITTWGYPAFIAAGDLNGDGKPEIVTTHLFESAVAVLRNTTPGVPLGGVVSRKIHGDAGAFDIDLTSGAGIECRSGGSTGDYTIVFSFVNPLTSVGGASMSSGTGSVVSDSIDPNDAHNYIVNLTGVIPSSPPGGGYVTVNLTDVADSSGALSHSVSATMGVLIGDADGNGRVDGNDVSAVQSHSRQAADYTNYRYDLDTTGRIDGNDVSATQAHTRTSLP